MPVETKSLAITERVLYLRTLPLLDQLPASELASIARVMKDVRFAPGEVIAREEEPVTKLHLLTSGSVRASRRGHAMGSISAPNQVGFFSILARMPDGFEIVAETKTTGLQLDSDSVYELLDDEFLLLEVALRSIASVLLAELEHGPAMLPAMLGAPAPRKIPARELDIVERIFFLRTMLPFQNSDIDGLAALARVLTEHRFPAGRRLWQRGEPGDQVLLIASGSVEGVTKDGRAMMFGEGSAVGGFDAMARRPRWFEAVTATDVVALGATTEEMMDVFEDNYDLASDFLALASNRLIALWDEWAARGVLGERSLLSLERIRASMHPVADASSPLHAGRSLR